MVPISSSPKRLNLFDLMKQRQQPPQAAAAPAPTLSPASAPLAPAEGKIIPFPGPLAKAQLPRKNPVVIPDFLK